MTEPSIPGLVHTITKYSSSDYKYDRSLDMIVETNSELRQTIKWSDLDVDN